LGKRPFKVVELTEIEAMPPTAAPQAPKDGARRVYVETYGCQMNVADSELVTTIMRDAGYRIVERPDGADIILINTCAVREHAEERVIGRASQLHGLRNRNPQLTIGILGCMAQHLAKTLPQRAPFVDLVMGPDSYRRLPEILQETSDDTLLDLRLSRAETYAGVDPTRTVGTNAWVTAIRGCDKFCTFCVVPFVRGRERSVNAAEILRQIEKIAAAGYKEITLLGQTVNSYDDGSTDFADLLRLVSQVPGIERIRFTSPYPKDFHDLTIRAMAEIPAVCPSLHLPVQSGSDDQLAAMRRGYDLASYLRLVEKLRRTIPDLALTTDIIVGFCGETNADFESTCQLMREIRYDSAFTFKYSERAGTYASKNMQDDVPESVKGERLQQVIQLQEEISFEINQQRIGGTEQVLVEGPSRRQIGETRNLYGRSRQGKTVIFPQPAPPNSLIDVTIHRTTSHTLFGDSAADRN
jgi:tRNA-2-methylthio-N6-dimethylallyladenosine synthase